MSSLHAQAWRSMHRDDSVVDNKIERATLRRVLRFARPQRKLIVWFLVFTVLVKVQVSPFTVPFEYCATPMPLKS